MSKTQELLRAQFDELKARREAIVSKSAPLREERDRIRNEARERELVLKAQIKEIEKDLAEIDRDMALLARALGGRRMSDSARR